MNDVGESVSTRADRKTFPVPDGLIGSYDRWLLRVWRRRRRLVNNTVTVRFRLQTRPVRKAAS
jgi:hypothetical protein